MKKLDVKIKTHLRWKVENDDWWHSPRKGREKGSLTCIQQKIPSKLHQNGGFKWELKRPSWEFSKKIATFYKINFVGTKRDSDRIKKWKWRWKTIEKESASCIRFRYTLAFKSTHHPAMCICEVLKIKIWNLTKWLTSSTQEKKNKIPKIQS